MAEGKCAEQTRSVGMPRRRKGIGALVAKEPEAYDPWDALPGAEELFPEEEVYDPWGEVGIAAPAIRRVKLTPSVYRGRCWQELH